MLPRMIAITNAHHSPHVAYRDASRRDALLHVGGGDLPATAVRAPAREVREFREPREEWASIPAGQRFGPILARTRFFFCGGRRRLPLQRAGQAVADGKEREIDSFVSLELGVERADRLRVFVGVGGIGDRA